MFHTRMCGLAIAIALLSSCSDSSGPSNDQIKNSLNKWEDLPNCSDLLINEVHALSRFNKDETSQEVKMSYTITIPDNIIKSAKFHDEPEYRLIIFNCIAARSSNIKSMDDLNSVAKSVNDGNSNIQAENTVRFLKTSNGWEMACPKRQDKNSKDDWTPCSYK